ncbi:uncharacterized protein BJ171DRAFT_528945 [Polychytrium aggregatum]|uniref:uncharacterized protein n=1 Tax=Polychytrium aggregatum TaxID=110093 RepID=UPI0022FDC913|nr:uncharacterized protein BJ171DRAFT_528945 [Polychytrium aggregatum]KAI9193347.1 hypothetical protein BJ171DRAFT_528945 [Polychytrium aggregatum]
MLLDITAVVASTTSLIRCSTDGPLGELLQTALGLFVVVESIPEGRRTWTFFANSALAVVQALALSPLDSPAAADHLDRIRLFFTTASEFATEVDAQPRTLGIFKGQRLRKRIVRLCGDLDALWTSASGALSVDCPHKPTQDALQQAVLADETREREDLDRIAQLLKQHDATALDHVGIRLDLPEWHVRECTASLFQLVDDPSLPRQLVDGTVAPLLELLQSQSAVARSMKREAWRIPRSAIGKFPLHPFASGGFGQVYKTSYYGSDVAVKQILVHCGEKEIGDFRREIGIWHRLGHPHVLPLSGACDTAEKPFMVSPFMPNGTLRHYVSGRTTRSLEDKLRLVYQVASGMSYLHGSGVVHGDLKPLNILIDTSFNAVITDFGMSRTKHTSASSRAACTDSVQGGTLDYMAPEMLDDEHAVGSSYATDIYAFAIVLYEVLNDGRSVWLARDGQELRPAAVERQVCRGSRPQRLDGIPDSLWSLIERCWHQDPAQRPKFSEILASLEPFKSTRPSIAAISQAGICPAGLGYRSELSLSQLDDAVADIVAGSAFQDLCSVYRIPRPIVVKVIKNDADACLRAAQRITDSKAVTDPCWVLAAQLYRQSADAGSIEASFQMGWLRLVGLGLDQSDVDAYVHWEDVYTRSNDPVLKPIATLMLGWLRFLGRGVEKDRHKGLQLMHESTTSEFSIGKESLQGWQVPASMTAAATTFYKLCLLGSPLDPLCKYLTDVCSYRGFGAASDATCIDDIIQAVVDFESSDDNSRASTWYGWGIEENSADVCVRVGKLLTEGKPLTDPSWIKAAKLFQRGADEGHSDGGYQMGWLRHLGIAVDQRDEEAFEYWHDTYLLSAGAAIGAFAGLLVQLCYITGRGTERDWFKALQIEQSLDSVAGNSAQHIEFHRWCEQGSATDPFCKLLLGLCFYHGIGVAEDLRQAAALFEEQAGQGDATAQAWTAECYFYGDGVRCDYQKAVSWYLRSAENGSPWGQFELGLCYHVGAGVHQDSAEAIQWYRKSAKQGYDLAASILENLGDDPSSSATASASLSTAHVQSIPRHDTIVSIPRVGLPSNQRMKMLGAKAGDDTGRSSGGAEGSDHGWVYVLNLGGNA